MKSRNLWLAYFAPAFSQKEQHHLKIILDKKMKRFPIWILLAILLLKTNDYESYKILLIPVAGRSHVFGLTGLGEELVRRGHQVSLLVKDGFPVGKDLESNETGIRIERYQYMPGEEKVDFDTLMRHVTNELMSTNSDVKNALANLTVLFEADARRLLLHNEPLFEHLKNEKFDLVVADYIIMMKSIALVPHRLGIPWVAYADVLDPLVAGVPWLPSFVPQLMLPYSDRMTFVERVKNLVFAALWSSGQFVPKTDEDILAEYQQYGAFENLDQLASNVKLWFLSKDVVLDCPKPSMPNMIDVGGLTAKPADGQLSKVFDTFMAKGRAGVILMTFGSNFVTYPASMAKKFLAAFRRLSDFSIIWRFGNVDNLDIPDNVMIAEWLPQNDILADDRVKLFLTHCGNSGQFEAVYHGVPMIGFPITGDHPYNAARIAAKGYGLTMDVQEFTEHELVANVLKVAFNKGFKEKIRLASKIFRSAPQSPRERAVYWIEHIINFGGDHLRSAGLELSFVQYYMLDILVFLVSIFAVVILIVVIIIKYVLSKCYVRKLCR